MTSLTVTLAYSWKPARCREGLGNEPGVKRGPGQRAGGSLARGEGLLELRVGRGDRADGHEIVQATLQMNLAFVVLEGQQRRHPRNVGVLLEACLLSLEYL